MQILKNNHINFYRALNNVNKSATDEQTNQPFFGTSASIMILKWKIEEGDDNEGDCNGK